MKGWLPRRTLPVLMYHRIGPCPGGDRQLWVTEETFVRHLQWLRDRGLRALGLDEAYECFRSEAPEVRELKGWGLGLAVVKSLVETMEGATGFESTPGKGSAFWFTIPLA